MSRRGDHLSSFFNLRSRTSSANPNNVLTTLVFERWGNLLTKLQIWRGCYVQKGLTYVSLFMNFVSPISLMISLSGYLVVSNEFDFGISTPVKVPAELIEILVFENLNFPLSLRAGDPARVRKDYHWPRGSVFTLSAIDLMTYTSSCRYDFAAVISLSVVFGFYEKIL